MLLLFDQLAYALPYTESTALEPNGLEARQQGPCQKVTHLVDDGSPVQHILHRQVTSPMWCDGSEGCGVSFTEQDAYTISFNVDLIGTGSYEWISGGFAVSKSWIEGGSYDCKGDGADVVAVWEAIAHTSYKVRKTVQGNCVGHATDYTIYSPNENNRGGRGFYCVRGKDYVRYKGDEYWEHDVRKGGP